MKTQQTLTRNARRGAVAPLMALLLPVLLLFCGIVVNIAYMQLNRTELRVATDAAARAGGRAFSEFNKQGQDTVGQAINYAVSTAALNNVGAKNFQLNPAQTVVTDPSAPPPTDEITFGTSSRLDNGYGRYLFHPQDRTQVQNKTQSATAIRIVGSRANGSLGGSINMLFAGWGPFSQFEPVVASTATQVDRDIAIILDRSGSMLEFKDLDALDDACDELRDDGHITDDEYNNGGYKHKFVGKRHFPYSMSGSDKKHYELFENGLVDEWEYAKDVTDRAYWYYGTPYQYYSSDPAPRHCRWDQLEDAVNAFLDVLDTTDQEERVAMISFNSSARKNISLTGDFTAIRNKVANTKPRDGTNISAGMQKGLDSIKNVSSNPNARPYAAKTILVMTDGKHTSGGTMPAAKATQLVNSYNVVIHAVTFTPSVPQSSKDEMAAVALNGGGRYYHADTGEELVEIFREIANNLPTIITE